MTYVRQVGWALANVRTSTRRSARSRLARRAARPGAALC